MALYGAGCRRQAAGHGLHDVEGQSLRPAGGHGDIRRTQPRRDIVYLPRELHTIRHAQLGGQSTAGVQQLAAARQQQLDVRRQALHGPQQHGLILPAGKLRRVEQGDIPLRQAQSVPHGLPRLPRRTEAAEIHAHAGYLLHPGRRVVRRGPPGIPCVHGQQQVGLGRCQQLRPRQQQLFDRRRLVGKQVAVHHIDDGRAVFHATRRPAGEERCQRRVGDDQIVVLPLHHPPQQLCRPEVGRGGHLLLQRQRGGHIGKGDVPHGAAAGYIHLPAQLTEAPEVGQVEIDDMGKCGRRDKNGRHRRSSSSAVMTPRTGPACCRGNPTRRCSG